MSYTQLLFLFHHDSFLNQLLTWEQNLWPFTQIDDLPRLMALNCAQSYKPFRASIKPYEPSWVIIISA